MCARRWLLVKTESYGDYYMKLHPWFVTGLVDGEGCFSVSFSKRKRMKMGLETRPSFSISLNRRDLALIKALEEHFKCGGIRFSKSDNTYKYEVRSIQDLVKRVIPHFKEFPLQGAKRYDFERFEQICFMIHANLHLNKAKLLEIIELACRMNTSGKRKYSKSDLLRVLDK